MLYWLGPEKKTSFVLAGEAALGMMLLGKLFEKFDLSAEMTN